MKKFIYVALLTLVASISISSCTEENIKPQDGGDPVTDPWKKP